MLSSTCSLKPSSTQVRGRRGRRRGQACLGAVRHVECPPAKVSQVPCVPFVVHDSGRGHADLGIGGRSFLAMVFLVVLMASAAVAWSREHVALCECAGCSDPPWQVVHAPADARTCNREVPSEDESPSEYAIFELVEEAFDGFDTEAALAEAAAAEAAVAAEVAVAVAEELGSSTYVCEEGSGEVAGGATCIAIASGEGDEEVECGVTADDGVEGEVVYEELVEVASDEGVGRSASPELAVCDVVEFVVEDDVNMQDTEGVGDFADVDTLLGAEEGFLGDGAWADFPGRVWARQSWCPCRSGG